MQWWKTRGAASEADADDAVTLPGAEAGELDAAAAPPPAPAAAHPLVVACASHSISSPEQLTEIIGVATAAREQAIARASAEAVRCFGQADGPGKAMLLASASFAQVQDMSALWQETADAKFGIGKNGEAPARVSEAADPNAPLAGTGKDASQADEADVEFSLAQSGLGQVGKSVRAGKK